MSIQVQVPVSNLLVSGLSSVSSLPPVQAAAENNSQSSQDVYIPLGQGPDMRPASFHLNQFWTLMGQPVDMATEGQGPDMVVQPPDMVAGQPVDM
ncbi:MAG TPA: hypothetical protein VFW62_00340 [bacterium]|nr:hypothetical protein [bacterium]